MKKPSILYINTGSGLSDVQSGGSLRHIETAKIVATKYRTYTLTTIGGLGNYKNYNLSFDKEIILRSHLWKNHEDSNFDRVISYAISTLNSLLLFAKKKIPYADIVYSTSDYFCDVIPAVVHKLLYKSKYVAMVHHRAKSPLDRKGNFIFNLLSFVFQRFSFFLIGKFSNMLFVYDTPEGELISTLIKPEKSLKVKNGINLNLIKRVKFSEYKYAACFAGGLRETKGLYDIIPVWKNVIKTHPTWKLAVAGGGTGETHEKFSKLLNENNLTKNIDLLGPLQPDKLYELVKSSRVFLSLSHEEGWGISILEAIALGVPVIAFELPAFEYLGDKIFRVPMFDHKRFSEVLIDVSMDDNLLETSKRSGPKFAENYDWTKIGFEEVEFLGNA